MSLPTLIAVMWTAAHATQGVRAWDGVAGGLGMACITEALRQSPIPLAAWIPILPTIAVLLLTMIVRLSQEARIL